jgi:hypothetical protein
MAGVRSELIPVTGSSREAVAAAIRHAVDFLRRRQLTHGEFATMLFANRQLADPVADSSPFATAFVVYALTHVDRAAAGAMIDGAAAFLAAEMEFGGVWRYWSTRQHKHARLPPDLDDTACASSALKIAGRPVPRNAWAFLANRDVAGRFRTWLLPAARNRRNPWFAFARAVGDRQARARMRAVPVPASEDPRFRVMHIDPGDVDPVVNANVLLYLGERTETLAAAEFLAEAVRERPGPPSAFYEDPLALDHAVARAFRHAAPRLSVLRETIVARVARRAAQPGELTPLQAAMALSALLTFDPDAGLAGELLRRILAAQRPDGGWPAYAYYNVWGSEELTTAFCLEALALAS